MLERGGYMAKGGEVSEIRGGIRYVKGQETEWHRVMSFDIAITVKKRQRLKHIIILQDYIKYSNGELNEDDYIIRKSRDGKEYKGSYVVYRKFPKYDKGGYIESGEKL